MKTNRTALIILIAKFLRKSFSPGEIKAIEKKINSGELSGVLLSAVEKAIIDQEAQDFQDWQAEQAGQE